VPSVEGVCKVLGINYTLNEKFRGGVYEIVIRDITFGVTSQMPE
jgi:hypothetical protein